MNPKQLLIIEDEPDVAHTLGEIIDTLESKVDYVIAHDGLKALEIIKTNDIDCVVTDIRMPNCDGLEFTRKLRDLGLNIPVIFISGEGGSSLEKKIRDIGGVDFLVKPFDTASFCYLLEDTLDLD